MFLYFAIDLYFAYNYTLMVDLTSIHKCSLYLTVSENEELKKKIFNNKRRVTTGVRPSHKVVMWL